MKARLYHIAAIVLLVGLTASAAIYIFAEHSEENALLSDFEHSKRFRHDLELTGGQAMVQASEFMNWFEGLWEGETLAFTVAGISIFLSLAVCFIAWTSPPNSEDDSPENRGRTGGGHT